MKLQLIIFPGFKKRDVVLIRLAIMNVPFQENVVTMVFCAYESVLYMLMWNRFVEWEAIKYFCNCSWLIFVCTQYLVGTSETIPNPAI